MRGPERLSGHGGCVMIDRLPVGFYKFPSFFPGGGNILKISHKGFAAIRERAFILPFVGVGKYLVKFRRA